mgnify:CR=1 FL=1
MTNNNYPQFISNLPCGEDYTEGKSQERLAVAIAEHIISTDSKDENQLSRIIGLKGEWGTGKSNVIKILDKPNEKLQEEHAVLKQIKDGYHIFEYDAWGHQEDLQRRSFLETLTKDLISEEILYGETTIETKKGDLKTVTWEEKLKYLLATKREFETETKPKLNDCFVLAVLVTIFTPICAIIANVDCISEIWWLSILITIIPILGAIGFLLWKKHKDKWSIKNVFQEIVSIYSGKIQNDVSYETVSEDEPSVTDFKKWMEDISNRIGKPNKKLIVVYDNMDRLPADKVKELWSSIHTFFAENGFKNIWVIIPFDEKHLSCAFGENEDKEQLTRHFISKTFPVVYRVTPPVITDYQKLFDNLYSQAFGETEEKNREKIYRILRLEKPNATIREMIEFINSLVALKQIWKEDIDLLYCAVFKLKENDIINHPIVEYIVEQDGETHISTKDATIEEEILSGYYLGDYIKNIIPNDETLQTNISALVYGVSKDLAKQIPMIKYIDSCFEDNSNDINKYSQSSKFVDILQTNIQDADKAKTDNIIKSLSKLNIESLSASDKTKISILWDELTKRKEDQKLSQQEFDDSYQSLLLYVNDKENLLARLCERLQSFGKEENVDFSGANYYNALKSIQDFISGNNIGIDITHYLTEIEKEPKIFVNYVQAAKEDYKTFKLSTDNKKLNNLFKENKLEDLAIINYIKDNPKYNFEELKQYIETFIPSNKLDATNFKPILDAYKLISDMKPLHAQLTLNQRNQIWNHFAGQVDTNEYLEIAAIQLANWVDIGGELSYEQTAYIALQMDFYENYGSLLLNGNNANLYKVLKYMTENKLGCELSLDSVLPQFFNIKNKINVTEVTLLIQLAKWSDQKNVIAKDNIQSIVPKDLYQFTKETANDLTKHINETAIDALSLINENTLLNQLNQPNQPNNYWYKVVENLIDTDFCNPLPENIFNIGIRYLKEVASNGTIPQENSVRARIIERLDKKRTGAAIEEIRNLFCNSQSTITTQKFRYLENCLRLQGKLKSRSAEVIHHIIDPIINDNDCLKILANNAGFYKELFDEAGNEASVTKQKIEKAINRGNAGEKILEFGKLIGITKENKDKQ